MTTPALSPQLNRPMDAVRASVLPRAGLRAWLAAVAGLVFAMIVVGGLTRLTDSGLSITEWQPIIGALPPLTDADWQAAFAKYQLIPQYASVNRGMALADFKFIFWWEWAHRFLGRLIGLAMALPLAAFWLAGRLTPKLAGRLLGVTALIGIQGAAGWYMVKSGLANRIDVSPYRLALHLSLAFVILGCLVWLICELAPKRNAEHETGPAAVRQGAKLLAALIFSQVALGGLVAGLKAGRAFNTWPLMEGRFIPDGIGRLHPWWMNLTENMAAVQFDHRLMAYLIVVVALWHAAGVWRAGGSADVSRTGLTVAGGVLAQAALGIVTLLNAVPLGLGIAHQALAALVFAAAIAHVHAAVRHAA